MNRPERPRPRRHRMPRRHEPGRIGVRVFVSSVVALSSLSVAQAGVAGYFYWQDTSTRASTEAAAEAEQLARDGAVAMLAYSPFDVDTTLHAAANLLTGDLRDRYAKLADDVVIPTAKAKQVTVSADVMGSALLSVSAGQCVVLVFINQSSRYGDRSPIDAASAVKVTVGKIDGRWLISGFDPV